MRCAHRNRIVLVGLDGMPYHLIDELAQQGTMPAMKALIDQGIFRQMTSSIPEISSVAWSSIITGTNTLDRFPEIHIVAHRRTSEKFVVQINVLPHDLVLAEVPLSTVPRLEADLAVQFFILK